MTKTEDYSFEHKCDKMPTGVEFLKLSWSRTNQFTYRHSETGAVNVSVTLYGFRYCPYCGEDMKGDTE